MMKSGLAVFAIALVGACTGPVAVPSVAPAGTTQPTPTLAPPTAAPTAAPKPTPAAAKVMPGETWIVYEWGVPEADSVGNMVIRPDGTDEHWATPDAPIGTGEQGGDGWQLHPDWSPDGEQIVYEVDANTPEVPGEKRDIWISNADGSETRQVFDCERPCDSASYPAWSKDGKAILFVSWEHENKVSDGSVLQSLDVATGEVTTLAETAGPEYFAYPRWSPDGMRIVAQVDTWSDITESSTLEYTSVVVVDLQASPPTITPVTQREEWANYPDWHPTEDLIVYSRRPEDHLDLAQNNLYLMKPDGSNPTPLVAHDAQPGRFLGAEQPTWMPDGTGITFVRVPNGDYSQATMWAVDADGSNLRSFPDDPHGGSHPRLRPLP